jgi:hypothetical protein
MTPEHNHLVIGLGGTGCAVVRELHKQLFVEWNNRQQNAGDKKATGASNRPDVYDFEQRIGQSNRRTRVATLSIDSNEDELTGGADQWRVLGEQLTLADTERLLLVKSGTGQMLANLKKYPGVEPWVSPDIKLIEEITRGSGKPEGCDQIRRLGRLVLADRTNLQGLKGKVNKQMGELRKGGVNDVTFHICATLGCGTGSGILVDTIVQLRQVLKESAGGFPIYLYVFITGESVPADVGNFHANQYGALQELNALLRGNYRPWDISNDTNPVRLEVKDAFQSCFLVSGVSDGGQVLSLNEQVQSVGEFLFQKFTRLDGTMPPALLKAHSFEDVSPFPEDTRDNSSGRSTRFASFGIKRLGIPDQEIHKKLALTFSSQGSLALIYANWDSQIGFAKARRSGFDSDKFVLEAMSTWSMRPEQLCLDESAGYLAYETDWKSVSDDTKADTMATTKDYKSWAELYRSMLEEFCQKGFRGSGLDNFFKPKTEDNNLADRARELVGRLERSLLEGWLYNKEHHVTDNLAAIVSTTRGLMERYQQAFKERLTAIPLEREKMINLRDLNDGELQCVGLLAAGLGKHKDIFHAYTEASRMLYTFQTEERAATYAISLIDKLLPLLSDLRGRVERVDTLFKKLATEWTEESSGLLKKPEKGDAKSENADLVYYVNHDEISEMIKKLTLNKDAADSEASALRRVLDRVRGQSHDFEFVEKSLFTDEKSNRVSGDLRNQLERASYTIGHEVHKTQVEKAETGFKPVLRLNIVKKLHDDHGGVVSDELKADLEKLMAKAMPALAFDYGAQQPEHGPSSPVQRCCLFIPQCASLQGSNFRDQLCAALRRMQGNQAREIEIYDVPEERNSSEIVFLSTAHYFPLRLAKPVVALKQRYETKLNSDPLRTPFLHFGETHRPSLPDLMMKDDSGLRQEAMPYLVLAAELGLVHVLPGDELDAWDLVLGEKDDFNRIPEKIELGMKCSPEHRKQALIEHPLAKGGSFLLPVEVVALLGAYEQFDTRKLNELKSKVTEKARTKTESSAGLKALKDVLMNRSGEVFVARGTKEKDTLYQLFDTAAKQASGILDTLR